MTGFIAATTGKTTSLFGDASFTIAKPAGSQAGDLAIITAIHDGGVTFSLPTGFTSLDELTAPGGGYQHFSWAKTLTGSEGSSFTVSLSGGNGNAVGICSLYRGASDLHVHNGAVAQVISSSNQMPATAPSVDADAKELLVVAWGWRTDFQTGSGGQAVPAGMTKRASDGGVDRAICLADILELPSGGATGSKLATTPSSENNEYTSGQQFAFTVAGGGGLAMLV